MPEKKNVAIIDNSIDVTGALNAILNHAEFAKDQYCFIFLLPSGSRATKKIKARGYKVLELPFLEISKSLKSLLLYLPCLFYNAYKLKKIIKQYDIKLVHVNDFYNLTSILAKMMGVPFPLITHVRFMPDRFPSLLVRLWMKLNLKYAEAIVCVSQAVMNLLPSHSKIQVIYDSLPNLPVCHKIIEEKEYINLLYLAHYIPGKGQDFALEAFTEAYQQNPKLRLKFIGGDMGLEKNKVFKEKLIKRAAELGLRNVVTFSGPVSDVGKEIVAADIVLNFSESESFSMTCLEALFCGTPLIAADCGGPTELFVHEESGWLVPNKDIDAMSKAIIQVSEDMKLRQKFSVNSATYVRSKFSIANTLFKLKNLYQLLLLN